MEVKCTRLKIGAENRAIVRLATAFVVLLTIACFSAENQLSARPKDDVVILENGDILHGEIKGLQRGVLTLKTDWMGTVQIEWIHVKEIRSNLPFEVVLSDGRKGLGTLRSDPVAGVLEVSGRDSALEAGHVEVVGITPIEGEVLSRLSYSIELGASYYSSNRSKQLTLASDVKYRTETYAGSASFNNVYSQQQDAEATKRKEVKTSGQRFFGRNWSVIGIANFLTSEELNLDLRSMFGGGVTKELIRTNRAILTVLGGTALNRERYSTESVRDSMEGLSSINFQTFRFDKPEFDITTTLSAIPSFSDWGRTRLEFDASVRFKLFRDLYWSGSLFDNYDSSPPEGNRKNDFGVQTTFGWSFN